LVDALEEIDISNGSVKWPTYVKGVVCELLKGSIDCFACDYMEMPSLDWGIVEHSLPIKQGFRPYRQPARSFNTEVMVKVKEEIKRLLKAGFIQLCRYAKWVSNIMPIAKMGTGKIRVCVDFRNLNRAMPKDEYPMLVANMLVNNASGHR
jgi:hypothetical protein